MTILCFNKYFLIIYFEKIHSWNSRQCLFIRVKACRAGRCHSNKIKLKIMSLQSMSKKYIFLYDFYALYGKIYACLQWDNLIFKNWVISETNFINFDSSGLSFRREKLKILIFFSWNLSDGLVMKIAPIFIRVSNTLKIGLLFLIDWCITVYT